MNFLAHTYLSCSNEELLIGNFLADFMRNKDVKLLPQKYLKGIELHRKIDSFTDSHPDVQEVNKRFHKLHGKYAPVVTDILFDFVLGIHWSKYSGEDMSDFMNNVYQQLLKYEHLFPSHRAAGIKNMIKGRFLHNYVTKEGLRFTFDKMESRTKYPSNFNLVVDSLDHHLPYLEKAFLSFFPDLINEVEAFCGC